MPFASFKFPQSLLNERQKEEIIHKTTDMFASYFGDGVRPYSMVLIDEWSMVAGDAPTKY